MTMTLLQVVQEFCGRTGLDVPVMVANSSDTGIIQLKGLANEVLTDLTSRGESWPALQKEALFTTVAAELQGTIVSIAPYGFKYPIPETLYDRTNRRPLYGPRGAAAWQQRQAMLYTGPFYSFRFWKGNVYMQPAPEAGAQIAFEYASDMAIQGPTSTSDTTLIYKKRFTFDSDVFLLDEDLLLLGLRWKWKKEKGLSFVTEKQDYEALLAQSMGMDSTQGALDMGGGSGSDISPGIFVPLGNWPV